jgi:hypothetical protein
VWHIYINLIPNEKGQYEIHEDNCENLAYSINLTYPGVVDNQIKALAKSKKIIITRLFYVPIAGVKMPDSRCSFNDFVGRKQNILNFK